MSEFNIKVPEINAMLKELSEKERQNVADLIESDLKSGKIKEMVEEKEENKDPNTEIRENLFEYIWAGIIYGHGGDGVASIHLQQTPSEQMAEDFFEWIKKEKGAKGFSLNSDRAMKYNVWCNQEGFIFTNEKYEPHEFDDLVVITY